MRHPLNSTAIGGYNFLEVTDQNSGLPDASGLKRHIGKDYTAPIGTPLYATENGTIINTWGNRQNVAGGNIIELQGSYTHRFLHLSEIYVSPGQQVTEGQLIGKTGNSGNVAAHLHHDVRRNGTAWNASLSNYVNFDTLLTQGVNEMADANDVRAIYQYGPLRRVGDEGGVSHYIGRKTDQILTDHANSAEGKAKTAYFNSLEQGLKDAQAAVASMQAKINELSLNPTKAEYAAVQAQLGDKLAELSATQTALDEERLKIKEKIVYIHDLETKENVSAILKLVKTLRGMLPNLFKLIGRK